MKPDTHASTDQTAGALFPVLLDLRQKRLLLVLDAKSNKPAAHMNLFKALQLSCLHLTVLLIASGEKLPDADSLSEEQAALRQMLFSLASQTDTLTLLEEPYRRSFVQGKDLVVSVSCNPALNDELHAVCRTLGIPVYIEHAPGQCDFFLEKDYG